MPQSIRTVIFILSFAIAASATAVFAKTLVETHPGTCGRMFIGGQYYLKISIAPRLTRDEEQNLRSWADLYAQHFSRSSAYFPGDLRLYVANQIPQSLLFKILTHDGATVTPRQGMQRTYGLHDFDVRGDVVEHLLLDAALKNSSESAWEAVERELEVVGTWTAEKKGTIEAEINRRVLEARAENILLKREQEFYRVKIDGGNIVLPDGKTYKIERRLKDGSLLFNVRLEHFLRTEDYPAGARVLEYMNDMTAHPADYAEGIMRAKGGRSIGALAADGRFFIMDGHARSRAYAALHDGNVLVDLPPSGDGKYYTMTHYEILHFYTQWFSFPDERKQVVQKAALNGSLEEMRRLYYEVFSHL